MNKNQLVSRISTAVLCLGLFVWALFVLPGGAVIFVLIFLIAAYFDYKRGAKNEVEGPNSELNMDGLIKKYGTPDHTIIANPTCGNDVEGCILVYHNEGFMIINGLEVKKSEITDCVLKNDASIPYLPSDYQLHISTTLDDNPNLYVPVGNEHTWAEQVLMELKNEMTMA